MNPSMLHSTGPEVLKPVCDSLEAEWKKVRTYQCEEERKGNSRDDIGSKRKIAMQRAILRSINDYHSALKCRRQTGRTMRREDFKCHK